MFDVLVYLYETYFRPDACPDQSALTRKLSALGFEHEEISDALGWLSELATTSNVLIDQFMQRPELSSGTRIYVEQEMRLLGTAAVGFIQFLESAQVLNPIQREIVIERALATGESPMPLNELRVIVLLVLWSQGKEPDSLMFEELFQDDDEEDVPASRVIH